MPKGGAPRRGESQEREKKKDMKFLEHGLKTRAIHDVPEYIIVEHVRSILG